VRLITLGHLLKVLLLEETWLWIKHRLSREELNRVGPYMVGTLKEKNQGIPLALPPETSITLAPQSPKNGIIGLHQTGEGMAMKTTQPRISLPAAVEIAITNPINILLTPQTESLDIHREQNLKKLIIVMVAMSDLPTLIDRTILRHAVLLLELTRAQSGYNLKEPLLKWPLLW
jgi:hypothetical protein